MKTKSNCLFCKIEFQYDNRKSGGKFCSNKCCGTYTKKVLTKEKIEKGLCSQNEILKRYLIEKHDEICTECGTGNFWNGKNLCLQVDHIDGNSDNCFPNNLRLICPNCHTQTDTFRNRGKKETKRNSYLRKYKSGNFIKEIKQQHICQVCGGRRKKRNITCSRTCWKIMKLQPNEVEA